LCELVPAAMSVSFVNRMHVSEIFGNDHSERQRYRVPNAALSCLSPSPYHLNWPFFSMNAHFTCSTKKKSIDILELTMMATQELVVPKSIPITSPTSLLLYLLPKASLPTELKATFGMRRVEAPRRRLI
jgi:hypothetical protein